MFYDWTIYCLDQRFPFFRHFTYWICGYLGLKIIKYSFLNVYLWKYFEKNLYLNLNITNFFGKLWFRQSVETSSKAVCVLLPILCFWAFIYFLCWCWHLPLFLFQVLQRRANHKALLDGNDSSHLVVHATRQTKNAVEI